MLHKEINVEVRSKKVIRRDTANPNLTENVPRIPRPRILDSPYNPPASRSKEERRDLKAHQIEVERRRSMALFYSRRNAIRPR